MSRPPRKRGSGSPPRKRSAPPADRGINPRANPSADRPAETPTTLVANASIAVDVVHADDSLIVVNKPAGLATQPGRGHKRDTLLNAVAAIAGDAMRSLGPHRDFGLLHRLDRETSGLIAIALTDEAYDRLRQAFAQRRVGKLYACAVRHPPSPSSGSCDGAIREVARQRLKIAAVEARPTHSSGGRSSGAQPALTHYATIAATRAHALLAAQPMTGRLHQVRAHLAELGSPIVGDSIYLPTAAARRKAMPLGRGPVPAAMEAGLPLMLHAWSLTLPSPDGEPLTLQADPPAAFREGLAKLQLAWPADARQRVAGLGTLTSAP